MYSIAAKCRCENVTEIGGIEATDIVVVGCVKLNHYLLYLFEHALIFVVFHLLITIFCNKVCSVLTIMIELIQIYTYVCVDIYINNFKLNGIDTLTSDATHHIC